MLSTKSENELLPGYNLIFGIDISDIDRLKTIIEDLFRKLVIDTPYYLFCLMNFLY